MKSTTPASPRSVARPLSPSFTTAESKHRPARWPGSALALRLIFTLGCLGLITSAARAQDQLDVGVRSTVVDKPFGQSALPDAGRHGKAYGILTVQLIPEEAKIVKPVDALKLKDIVCHELDTHGFHQVAKGLKPEILITVQYGRAWLWNPYMGGAQTTHTGMSGAGGTSPDGGEMAIQNLSMGDAKQIMRLHESGVEAKSQKAEAEKLCIKLTAWQFTTDRTAKAKQLWTTTMIVDDPDHWDLNAIAAEMLAAGAPYFDRKTKEEEVDVYKPLPDGRVNVGTPVVGEPFAPKSK